MSASEEESDSNTVCLALEPMDPMPVAREDCDTAARREQPVGHRAFVETRGASIEAPPHLILGERDGHSTGTDMVVDMFVHPRQASSRIDRDEDARRDSKDGRRDSAGFEIRLEQKLPHGTKESLEVGVLYVLMNLVPHTTGVRHFDFVTHGLEAQSGVDVADEV